MQVRDIASGGSWTAVPFQNAWMKQAVGITGLVLFRLPALGHSGRRVPADARKAVEGVGKLLGTWGSLVGPKFRNGRN
jgi:hypothetical protein